MKIYTFRLESPDGKQTPTESVTSSSAVSALNSMMGKKKFHGFKIIDAYCGRKSGKITQAGFVSYEYLVGVELKPPPEGALSKVAFCEFDELLGEVDSQCSKKDKTHAE